MKKLIWELVWKVVSHWREVAYKNEMQEQEVECIQIQQRMQKYKRAMEERGIW